MRVRLLSRASDLARLQALLVQRALHARYPDLHVDLVTRVASGDRDVTTPLTALVDKGAFTSDLSNALASGEADAVVHSWKDLPLEGRSDTTLAATLERADPRDVLLVRREVLDTRPRVLRVLSSSPRRSWLLSQALPELLPWPVDEIAFADVRGNITTRLKKLANADALVVAKAALDRLLSFGPPFESAAAEVRALIAPCAWMVMPIRDVPGAPAQGALAIEALRSSPVIDLVRAISHQPTWDAVQKEREVLASYGGGCHQALGATVLPRDYGRIVSVRGRSSGGAIDRGWSLIDAGDPPPPALARAVWPRPDERHRGTRRPIGVPPPSDPGGFWVARAEALPDAWTVDRDRLVWAAGTTTWKRLAARGVWVNGCADGLGDLEPPAVDALAGRVMTWHRLTHSAAAAGDLTAIATYAVEDALPADLPDRTHFFWTSGVLFQQAIERWPLLAERWHFSGPGRTWRTIRERLGPAARVFLDYDDFFQAVVR